MLRKTKEKLYPKVLDNYRGSRDMNLGQTQNLRHSRQRKNPRKAVQPFENKKRKIDIFKNYEANGVEKIQRKLEIFSTLISKKSSQDTRL